MEKMVVIKKDGKQEPFEIRLLHKAVELNYSLPT